MTTMAKKETVQRNWYVLDAAGKPLGRTAVTAAKLLRGKHKVDFTPNVDCGDFVIIVNVDKAVLTGKKLDNKHYYLGRAALTRCKIYKGAEHNNAAQKPEAWTLD